MTANIHSLQPVWVTSNSKHASNLKNRGGFIVDRDRKEDASFGSNGDRVGSRWLARWILGGPYSLAAREICEARVWTGKAGLGFRPSLPSFSTKVDHVYPWFAKVKKQFCTFYNYHSIFHSKLLLDLYFAIYPLRLQYDPFFIDFKNWVQTVIVSKWLV